MSSLKSLKDFLSNDSKTEEIYITDQKYRFKRAKKGMYSKQGDCFDFIYLVQNWEEIVGPMLSQNTTPLKVKGDALIVITKHAIFSQELGFMSPIILKKIEQKFPKFNNQFSKIKFITSEKYFNLPDLKKEISPKKNVANNHTFSPIYQKKLLSAKSMFSGIEDEEVKELLISLYLQQS